MSPDKDKKEDRRLMTVTAYARREGVSRMTVWRWIKKGAVAVVRKGPKTGVRIVAD